MEQIKLKICGMKFPENIQEIALLKPDYLGFIFWDKSIRKFDLYDLPEFDSNIKKVGVFVDATFEEIKEKIELFQLNVIQLHGKETPEFCKKIKSLNVEVIKSFSIDNNFIFNELYIYINEVDCFLFDTKGKSPGGNGITFNWKILDQYRYEIPYFLSGGIGKTEVDAIKDFLKTKAAKKCIAIDVNSRFETKPGCKSVIKLRKFKKFLYEN